MIATPSTTPEPGSERRSAARFQPAFGTICRFRLMGETGEHGVGLVWNISETGVSMLLGEPPTRGSTLDAELTTESGAARVPVKLHVVHVREMPHGDFFLGAHLEQPLTVEELQKFLAPPPVPGKS
jgi:hypothetical protein